MADMRRTTWPASAIVTESGWLWSASSLLKVNVAECVMPSAKEQMEFPQIAVRHSEPSRGQGLGGWPLRKVLVSCAPPDTFLACASGFNSPRLRSGLPRTPILPAKTHKAGFLANPKRSGLMPGVPTRDIGAGGAGEYHVGKFIKPGDCAGSGVFGQANVALINARQRKTRRGDEGRGRHRAVGQQSGMSQATHVIMKIHRFVKCKPCDAMSPRRRT